MSEVDPEKPGVNPQPWIGIQYVSIRSSKTSATRSPRRSSTVARRQTVDEALEKGQEIAQRAGDLQKEEG